MFLVYYGRGLFLWLVIRLNFQVPNNLLLLFSLKKTHGVPRRYHPHLILRLRDKNPVSKRLEKARRFPTSQAPVNPQYQMAGPTHQQRSPQSFKNVEHCSCNPQALPRAVMNMSPERHCQDSHEPSFTASSSATNDIAEPRNTDSKTFRLKEKISVEFSLLQDLTPGKQKSLTVHLSFRLFHFRGEDKDWRGSKN